MPFDDSNYNNATFAKDYSPNANRGTVNGATYLPSGGHAGDGAYDFSGGNYYINAAAPNVANWTVSAWVKRASGVNNYKGIVEWSTAGSLRNGIGLDNTGKPAIIYGTGFRTDTSVDVDDDQWHHLVGTYSGAGTQKLYLDAMELSLGGETGPGPASAPSVLRIGDFTAYNYYFGGIIDDVRIYNSALSDKEVNALYIDNSNPSIMDSEWIYIGDTWKACVTPYDGEDYGSQNCSNNLTVKGILPTYDDFKSYESTTNFSLEDINLGEVYNPILGVPGYGQIMWDNAVYASGQNYDNHVRIGDKFISVNVSGLHASHNSSAEIRFLNVDCNNFNVYYQNGYFSTAAGVRSGGSVVATQNEVNGNCLDASVCTYVYCDDSILSFGAVHFSGFATSGNTDLNVWDDTDNAVKFINQDVRFYANYTNSTSGAAITGATCTADFTDTTNNAMTYNATTTLYEYSRTFGSDGTFNWNATCAKAGFVTLTANDNVTITAMAVAVPEFSTYALMLALVIVISGFLFVQKKLILR